MTINLNDNKLVLLLHDNDKFKGKKNRSNLFNVTIHKANHRFSKI